MSYTKDQLIAAVNYLIKQEVIANDAAALQKVVASEGSVPLRFAGKLEVLNPLVELAAEDEETYRNVIALVRRRRAAVGYEVESLHDPLSYNEYMRSFMAQKRERERRAVAVENMLRPANATLRGKARLAFMQKAGAEWKARRDAMLAAARTSKGSSLTREEQEELLVSFWKTVDEELDYMESSAREEMLKGNSGRAALAALKG